MKKMSMTDIRVAHKDKGGHFFDDIAMKGFNTTIETRPNKYNIFITAERMETSMPKKYTLRWYNPETYQIDTLGKFQGYDSLAEARDARKLYTKNREVLEAN
jgi:hypothetical protein